MTKKRRKLNKEFEKKIYSSKKNVELVLAKIYDIDDEDIQKEYMSGFNKVVNSYDLLKNDYELVGFTDNSEKLINNYNEGVVCGGSIHKFSSSIFRSSDGGIVSLDEDLNFISNTKIGDEIPSQLYSAEIINNKIYFGVTNFTDINLVKIYNSNNELESTFEVGLFPGDFAYWEFEEN